MWTNMCGQFCDVPPPPVVLIPGWLVALIVIIAVFTVATCIVSVMAYRIGAASNIRSNIRLDKTEEGMNACMVSVARSFTLALTQLKESETYLDSGIASCERAVACVSEDLRSSVAEVTRMTEALNRTTKNSVNTSLHSVATVFESGMLAMERMQSRTGGVWEQDGRDQWVKVSTSTSTSTSASTESASAASSESPSAPTTPVN